MKRIFAITIGFLLTTSVAMATFSDLSEDHVYFEAIDFLESRDVVAGYPDGTFGADNTLGRDELVKIVIEARFSEAEIQNTFYQNYLSNKSYTYAQFEDVGIHKWYAEYVAKAYQEGIVRGNPDGRFLPGEEVNFVEALQMIMQAYGLEYNTDTSIWYEDMVVQAAAANLIPLDIVGFNQSITRAQMAEMMTRTIKYDEGVLDDYLGEKKDLRQSFKDIAEGHNQLEGHADELPKLPEQNEQSDEDTDEMLDDQDAEEVEENNEQEEQEEQENDEEDEEQEDDQQNQQDDQQQDEPDPEPLVDPEPEFNDKNASNVQLLVDALEAFAFDIGLYPGVSDQAECLTNDQGAGLDLAPYIEGNVIPFGADPNKVMTVADTQCTGMFFFVPLQFEGLPRNGFVLIAPMSDPNRANFLLSELSVFEGNDQITAEDLMAAVENFDQTKVADAPLEDRILLRTN